MTMTQQPGRTSVAWVGIPLVFAGWLLMSGWLSPRPASAQISAVPGSTSQSTSQPAIEEPPAQHEAVAVPSADDMNIALSLERVFRSASSKVKDSIVTLELSGGKLPDRLRRKFIDEYKEENPWADYAVLSALEQQLADYRLPDGTASGIIFDSEGLILTNYHVVEERTSINVVFPDGREAVGEIHSSDADTDIALVKVDAKSLKPASFSSARDLRVGQWVVVVGAPYGLTQTVAHGIVSATARDRVAGMAATYQQFIQTDAPVHPGNSGGALLNLDGEVIGVVTGRAPLSDQVSAGIGFAIPSDLALQVVAMLQESGKVESVWLGVEVRKPSRNDAEILDIPAKTGLIVTGLYKGLGAHEAGIRLEDVITSIDGNPVKSLAQLRNRLFGRRPGDKVRVGILRQGRIDSVYAKLTVAPATPELRKMQKASSIPLPKLGLTGRTVFSGMIKSVDIRYNAQGKPEVFKPDCRGVQVCDVLREDVKEIKEGHLIVKCQNQAISSVGELQEVLSQHQPGEEVTIEIGQGANPNKKINLLILPLPTDGQ